MTTNILPHELPRALEGAAPEFRTLSLDCFDTLLWRHTHVPTDVFADIRAGATTMQRRWAESHARCRAALQRGRNEATIEEIYTTLMPNASDVERIDGVAAELAAEARHCFAFAPTVALMNEAKRQGLRVIVVSDTYLSRIQLRSLIAHAAGNEVASLIDAIFCSSEYGVSKCEGLFRHVLKELDAAPASLLHIGDNLAADHEAPVLLGIAARHLVQFPASTRQRLRQEAAASAVIHGGGEMPSFQPHRAPLALAEPAIDDQAMALGHSVVGPFLATFDTWLRDEAQAIRNRTGRRVHLLFLLRDGHLPARIFEANGAVEGVPAAEVSISRFTATAAGFRDRAAIERFLETELNAGDPRTMARQLLFEANEAIRLCAGTAEDFARNVLADRHVATVIARSTAFADRLVRHIRAAVDPQPGDTLMLVDLGYNGTVQSCIEPLLRDALSVDVAGRYLLLREHEISGQDKRGLIDGRHYDMTVLDALCGNVAVIEQLCTVAGGSVVDYRSDGRPVLRTSDIKGQQSDVRARVQQGCIRYAREGNAAFYRMPKSDDANSRRRAAAAIFARFLFLPLPNEIAVLERFEHDVNLGTGRTVALFDTGSAEQGLKRNGIFYLKEANRMFLPAELRGQGLPLSLFLLTQRRFGLDLREADFREPGIDLPIIVADGRDVSVMSIEAHKTHDGYYRATIPVGASQYAIGLQFGRLYEWVEVLSAEFEPVAALKGDVWGSRIAAQPSLEGMETVSAHLMRCSDDAAFMMVPPPPATGETLALTVVFRPIALRDATAALAFDPTGEVDAGVLM